MTPSYARYLSLLAALLLLAVAPPVTAIDYDTDDDRLIEVDSLVKLDAMRYDSNGNGLRDSESAINWANYTTAFPNADADQCPTGCQGYELMASLTFPASGAYSSWTPIEGWVSSTVFDGNGHTLTDLKVNHSHHAGLFGGISGQFRNIGMVNATVTSTASERGAGALMGLLGENSVVEASYAQGGTITSAPTINQWTFAGGLIGDTEPNVTVRAVWSSAAVRDTGPGNARLGGLIGRLKGHVSFSYSYGNVSPASGNTIGGLIGGASGTPSNRGSITSCYFNSQTAGTGDNGEGGTGYFTGSSQALTTAELQAPTGYTGYYYHWNRDLDGDGLADYLWNFGTSSQYPTLNTPAQRAAMVPPPVDYDLNDNDLIDVGSLTQLDAMRHDLDGNGTPTSGGVPAYTHSYPGRTADMGCPGTCAGYELTGALTFPASGDFSSWNPIRDFNTVFEGNHHTLTDLNVDSGASIDGGLFGSIASNAVVRNLGLVNPTIAPTTSTAKSHGALVGHFYAAASVYSVWVDGGSVTTAANGSNAGGLVGFQVAGNIRASYSTASVSVSSGNPTNANVGGLVGHQSGGAITASYASGTVTPGSGSGVDDGGLVGDVSSTSASITNSYCVGATGDCLGATGTGVSATSTRQTATQMQIPTGYTGIYANWNIDLDGDSSVDYPWNFGTPSQYPTLYSPTERSTFPPGNNDYDANDNGLIDISTPAQLNAIRWDGDGAGAPSNASSYAVAFPGRDTTSANLMGCPSGTCTGYELTTNLTLTDTSPNWTPIGDYRATFDGQGKTIGGLSVTVGSGPAGLFGELNSANGIIRNVGVLNPTVANSGTGQRAGGLVAYISTNANVATSYVSGGSVTVSGTSSQAGGLVGVNNGRIRASYATAAVAHSGNPASVSLGGLVGYSDNAEIVASYAAGLVTASTGSNASAGGLLGLSTGSNEVVTASYCDTTATMQSNCIGRTLNSSPATSTGYATTDLQMPTGYTDMYLNWNVDLDGDGALNYPWNFGTSSDYPTLNTPAQSTALIPAATDYDANDDGLIEISNLAQLNAIRWDLNGDGVPETTNFNAYGTAFGGRDTTTTGRMGCLSGTCTGYELTADLDLSGYTNWTPIGGVYNTTFDGNGHTISNLTATVSGGHAGLFREIGGSTVIREVGVINPTIRLTSAHHAGGLVGRSGDNSSISASFVLGGSITVAGNDPNAGGIVGYARGAIRASYSTASVTLEGTLDNVYAGGLVGWLRGGTITASYAAGAVTGSTAGSNTYLGGLVGSSTHTTAAITNSYCDTTGVTTQNSCVGADQISANTKDNAAQNKSTTQLQEVTGYTSIYANWNIDTDGVSGADDPWDFGTSRQYPVLKIDKDGDGTATWQEFGIQRLDQVRGISAMRTRDQESLIVSWTAVPGATGYKVQWKTGDEAYDSVARQAVITGGTTTTHTIPNLRADAVYTVRVIATSSDFDDGAPSADVSEGLAQVSGVQVTPGEGTLVVSWTAVPRATGYKVQWKSGDENYDAADRQAVVTDGTTYTIPNLIGGTEYTVRVIATNPDIDDGASSDGATGTPGGDGTPLPEPEPDTDPVFVEATDPQTYRQNKAIELTLPEAIDGNGTVTYSMTELPEGLSFDAETRIISGTPTAATEKAIYTVTATDEDGDTGEMSFFITVVANVAPSFGDASVDAQSYMRKQEIESLTLPQASGGDGTLTYALTPDLPTGLSFDAETRMLSGTPLEAIAETTYTLTATDSDGDAATLTFTLSVMADPMPAFGDTTIAAQGYQNQVIDPVTLPQATGGDGTLTYALMPDLPEGLTFNAETRIVSGTPVKAMDETTYTLTATDGNGDTVTLMFTLEIPDLMPTFGDTTIVAQSYLVNQRIESLALPQATGGDGTLAYILLPFLPDDLSFDPDTRTISGTPTEETAEATYTFSAFDADGDVASLPFTLEVSLPSPDIDGDGNVNFADFLTLASKYGSRRGQDRYDARCDLNGDGQIDFADFLIFAADFGSTG